MSFAVKKKSNERGDYVLVSAQKPTVSTGSAINAKILSNLEPGVNIGFSADSGCEEMNSGYY